jgi:glucose 1-dehydrogenase
MFNPHVNFHNATHVLQTKGIVSDGNQLSCTVAWQYGFEGWAEVETLAMSLCGGDFEGRVSLPGQLPAMAIGHEAAVMAKGSFEGNGYRAKAGDLFVVRPGRRSCYEFSDQVCPLGQEGCGLYANRGTSRAPGLGTEDNVEDPRFLIPLPDDLAEFGFLAEQVAIGEHVVRSALELKQLPQERVALLGMGPLGLLIAARLVDMGIDVMGYDVYASGPRREALEMLSPRVTFSDLTSTPRHAETFPLVIESAGGKRSLFDAVNQVAMGGTVLAVGIPMREDVGVLKSIVVKGATVKGIVSAERLDFVQAINSLELWLQRRPEFLRRLVTHRFHYTEFAKALRIHPKDRIKVALTFS